MKFLLFLLLASCSQVFSPTPMAPVVVPVSLSWENTTEAHPERAAWSKVLIESIDARLDAFSAANDVQTFCPKYTVLDRPTQVKAIAELMVAMSYYESGYDPKTSYRECSKTSCRYTSSGCFTHPTYGYCMKGNKNIDGGVITSRGLLQMSLSSSNSYGCGLKESNDLHDPISNLKCAVIILDKQIKREGVISATRSYWAVIKKGYSRNHVDSIAERVQKNVPSCR